MFLARAGATDTYGAPCQALGVALEPTKSIVKTVLFAHPAHERIRYPWARKHRKSPKTLCCS